MGRLLIALAVGASLLSTAPLQAQNRQYRRTVREALSEFNAGRWEEARALFRQAHEIDPSARTLRGMGQAAFEMRDYVGAYEALVQALEDTRRPLTIRQRREVEELVERTVGFVGRFELTLEPADAEVTVDLREPVFDLDGRLLLDVGDHTIEARAEGYDPEEHTITVAGAEESTIELQLQRPRPEQSTEPVETPSRALAEPGLLEFALWGSGAALLATMGGGIAWIADRNSELDKCDEPADANLECVNRDTIGGERDSAIGFSVAMGIAALAAIGTGFVFWFLREPEPEEPADARLGCGIGPSSVRCQGSF